MSAVPAHVLAAIDQHRAALRDLVRLAREHQQHGCELTEACAGRQVMNELKQLDRGRITAVAFTAIAMLAETEPDRTFDSEF
jgi:hypothetical protein